MSPKTLTDVLERVKAWPEQDQEALVEYVLEIEAQRTGIYVMTEKERAAVNEGLAEAERGEFVSEEDMDAFWKRAGVA